MRGRGEGTVEDRGHGRWRLRVYIGPDPLTGHPRQVSRTVRVHTKTEALKELRKLASEVDRGQHTLQSRTTVSQLLAEWMRHAGDSHATLTRQGYASVIKHHLDPGLGKLEVGKVTAYHLDRYYRAKAAAGMKPRTVRIHHSILSAAFGRAVKWGWIDRNPAALASPPKLDRVRRFTPEVDQVRQLIAAAGDDEDLKTSIMLLAITGCRRGELCGLKWADVNTVKLTLRIERQRIPVKGGDVTAPLKQGEGRQVALGPLGLAVIDHYRAVTEERGRQLGITPLLEGWLISPDCGLSPTKARTLGVQITRLGKSCGVPVTTHAFRRFAATFMVGSGVDVVTAARRLGHTPDVMLDAYAGFLPAQDVVAAGELERKVLGDD